MTDFMYNCRGSQKWHCFTITVAVRVKHKLMSPQTHQTCHFKSFWMRALGSAWYMLVCFRVCSPRHGRAQRKAWQGKMNEWRNPAACMHPPLSSGPPVGRTSDLNPNQDPHDTQVSFLTFTLQRLKELNANIHYLAVNLNMNIYNFFPNKSKHLRITD